MRVAVMDRRREEAYHSSRSHYSGEVDCGCRGRAKYPRNLPVSLVGRRATEVRKKKRGVVSDGERN